MFTEHTHTMGYYQNNYSGPSALSKADLLEKTSFQQIFSTYCSSFPVNLSGPLPSNTHTDLKIFCRLCNKSQPKSRGILLEKRTSTCWCVCHILLRTLTYWNDTKSHNIGGLPILHCMCGKHTCFIPLHRRKKHDLLWCPEAAIYLYIFV